MIVEVLRTASLLMALLHVLVLQVINGLMIMIFFSVAKISTNSTLVNQVIFAEVLPNA